MKEEQVRKDPHKTAYGENIHHHCNQQKNGESIYDPPLPVSVVKEEQVRKDPHKTAYGENIHHHCNQQKNGESIYDPPLPVSVVKEEGCYGGDMRPEDRIGGKPLYDPPLPVSVVKEEGCYGEKVSNSEAKYGQKCARQYDPPLPVSVVKDETKYISNDNMYRGGKGKPLEQNDYSSKGRKNGETAYDPPLPTPIVTGKHIII